MTRAPVLILDEPTAGLDPLMVQAFRDALAALAARGDTTVLLSSHVLADVERSCGRLGFIRAGRMAAVDTIANLTRRAARRVSVTFGAPVSSSRLPSHAAVTVVTHSEREWLLDVAGPLGPLVDALAALPVDDLQIEPFRLERHIAALYGLELDS
jgi:ABC-2 type transport system ATP-binding protein